MKNFKKVLALVLAVATLLSFATVASAAKTSESYNDASSISYEEAVDVLSAMGVLGGDDKGAFNPKATIKRSEAAKIIAIFADYDKAAGSFYAAANKFTDVPANHWAVSYIAYANQTGIVSGVGNGKFNPDGTLTGVQFLKMALCTLGFDAAAEGYVGANWAVNVLDRAKALDLTAGIEGFDAGAAITREQAAQIMLNVLLTDVVAYGTADLGIDLAALVANYKDVALELYNEITSWKSITKQFETVGDIVDEVVRVAQEVGKLNILTQTENGAKDTGIPYFMKWAKANNMILNYLEGEDDLYRPMRAWAIAKNTQDPDAVTKCYVDEPVKTYTSSITMCDLAKDLGFAATDNRTLTFVYCNDFDAAEYKYIEPNRYIGSDITEYYYTFSHKAGERGENALIANVSDSDTLKNTYVATIPMYCDDDLYTPGATIEVFQLGTYSFKIVSYYQFVGQVTGVTAAKTDKYGHETKASATIQLLSEFKGLGLNYVEPQSNDPITYEFPTENKLDLAEGDYVTFNLSAKKAGYVKGGRTYFPNTNAGIATMLGNAVINIAKADTFTGVYNRNKGGKMMIDSELYTVSTVASDEVKEAVEGYLSASRFKFNQKYTFVKDSQGNILHIDAFSDAYTLVIPEAMWLEANKKTGKQTLHADVVSITDGSKMEDIVLAPVDYKDEAIAAEDLGAWVIDVNDFVLTNDGPDSGVLFLKENANGTYWAKEVGMALPQYVAVAEDEWVDTVASRVLVNGTMIDKANTKFLVVTCDAAGDPVYTVTDWAEAKGYTCDVISVLYAPTRNVLEGNLYTYTNEGDGYADYVVMWDATPADSFFYAYLPSGNTVPGAYGLEYIDLEDGLTDMEVFYSEYDTNDIWGLVKITTTAEGTLVYRVESAEVEYGGDRYNLISYATWDETTLTIDGKAVDLAEDYTVSIVNEAETKISATTLTKGFKAMNDNAVYEAYYVLNDAEEVCEVIFVPYNS